MNQLKSSIPLQNRKMCNSTGENGIESTKQIVETHTIYLNQRMHLGKQTMDIVVHKSIHRAWPAEFVVEIEKRVHLHNRTIHRGT